MKCSSLLKAIRFLKIFLHILCKNNKIRFCKKIAKRISAQLRWKLFWREYRPRKMPNFVFSTFSGHFYSTFYFSKAPALPHTHTQSHIFDTYLPSPSLYLTSLSVSTCTFLALLFKGNWCLASELKGF